MTRKLTNSNVIPLYMSNNILFPCTIAQLTEVFSNRVIKYLVSVSREKKTPHSEDLSETTNAINAVFICGMRSYRRLVQCRGCVVILPEEGLVLGIAGVG